MNTSSDLEKEIKQKILIESAKWINDKNLVFNEESVQNVVEFSKVISTFFKRILASDIFVML